MTALTRPLALPGLALSLALALSAAGAQAAPQNAMTPPDAAFSGTRLDIAAVGEVRAAPDQAQIRLGVQTKAATAAQALSENAADMNRVIAALRRAGVAEKDIQTANINLQAEYDYQPNQPPRLTGYQASDDVAVTVQDLNRLGPALDAVVAAGANQINGISFGLKDPEAAENDARRLAVKALTAKAQLYAQATGAHDARLVRLSEGGANEAQPIRPMFMGAGMAKMATATPVQAGELVVRVDVSGTYDLTR